MTKSRLIHHCAGLLFFCTIFLMSTNIVSAQLFKDERLDYESTIQDRKKTIATLKHEIRDIRSQLRRLKREIEKHDRVLEDYKKTNLRWEMIRHKYLLNWDPQTGKYSEVDKSDWGEREKQADHEMESYPLCLSGDVVISSWRDLDEYRHFITQKGGRSEDALDLLEKDFRLITNELQKKENLLARLQKDITQMQSELAIEAIEGYWKFLKPKNDSTIHITYNKDKDKFIGRWKYVEGIKYYKVGDIVFILEPPMPDRPRVYNGTEYGFDDAGRKMRSPLIISLRGKMMTYRTKERTYTLKSFVPLMDRGIIDSWDDLLFDQSN